MPSPGHPLSGPSPHDVPCMPEQSTAHSRVGRMRRAMCLLLTGLILVCSTPAWLHAADDDDYKIARGLYDEKRWELAAKRFRSFLEEHPQHPKAALARLFLGLALVSAEDFQGAREELRRFAKDYPQDRNLPNAAYRIAECSYMLNDLPAAEREFTEFLKLAPQHALTEWALPYLGDTQLRLNEPEDAAATFQRALELHPEGRMAEDARFGLARAYELSNQNEQALQIYEQLAANRQGRRADQSQMKVGSHHFAAQEYAESAEAYDALATQFPQSALIPLSRLNAGYAYFQLGDYPQAIARFEDAARDQEQADAARFWIGLAYRRQNEFSRAAEAFQQALTEHPKSPLAPQMLYQLASCQYRAADYQAARTNFLRLVDDYPQEETADDSLYYAAEAALLQNQLDEVQTLLERFNQQYPNSPLFMRNELLAARLAAARGGVENVEQASAGFESVIQRSRVEETRALARLYYARLLQQQKEDQRAVTVLQPLLEQLMSTGDRSAFAEALVLAAVSQLQIGNFADARRSAERYLQLEPGGPQTREALELQALATAQLGDFQATVPLLQQLRQQAGQKDRWQQTQLEVAELAYQQEEWAQAAVLFQELVDETAAAADDTGGQDLQARGLSGLAWCEYQQKHTQQASDLFARVAHEYPEHELAPEAGFMHATALRSLQKDEEAADAFRDVFRRYLPETAVASGTELDGAARRSYEAGKAAAQLYGALSKFEEADAVYSDLIDRFPKATEAPTILEQWALLNLDAQDYEQSDALFRRLVTEYPQSDRTDNAALQLAESELVNGQIDTATESFRRLSNEPSADEGVREQATYRLISILAENQDWKQVSELAGNFRTRFPKSRFLKEVTFRLGEAQLNQNDPQSALQTLQQLVKESPAEELVGTEWFPHVWVVMAEAHLRLKQYSELDNLLTQVQEEFPQLPTQYRLDEIAGRSLKNRSRFSEARAAFERVIDSEQGAGTETAARSQFLIAETWLLEKKYKEALEGYLSVRIRYDYPEWEAAALFQAGQCDETLKQWDKARDDYQKLIAEFPESDLAPRAAERLKVVNQTLGQ